MASFSADSTPKAMPARFSPRAGNIGVQAAQQKGRGRAGGGGLGRSAPSKSQGGESEAVGRPAPEEDPSQPQDMSYLNLALQHFNMKGLGRNVPYLVWANLTGNYQRYAQPGRPVWDYLEDS
jgi:hypothetical protein